ncbi:hypothetical protein BASA50_010589 [Batrachochytrium salamandrivorans]|uniref:F-actin-capping protein subunit beta n=1 Tax=Batrachochytrium salamandrivorans TaxID=1357716 RepID=A0ABQ8EXZ2_9FUNG|nr:hypothetical protein BASA62_001735 [Batrachochytrium salamandrivorans]KAH6577129.1 hypothetical protein BASA60_004208 [Batrachochytrium salamandrivorans]KAH6588628.1 hypothetical protein BASA50_010589 [Batrachochytrium salamandrivorans]KAH6602305.1 hypothetical protein BASA61_001258 [Batrachochytrium salamandrivorans]KAH9269277.1 hypothetical protein BASA83_008639 [Batrachochytrium salamandrivorans]
MSDQLDCALDLMRRQPPSKTTQNLAKLLLLVPDLTEDLLSSVDQPLKIEQCSKTGKDFLLCDYNRDGDSHRSPWSNEYQPPNADGIKPSMKLQKLEAAANDAFDTYRELYFGGGASSVYLWDLEDGFAGVVLIKKSIDEGIESGSWDSIHVLEITEKGKVARYRITSTVMLQIVSTGGDKSPAVDLSGSVTRLTEQELQVDSYTGHIANIGRLVEDMEFKMRDNLVQIYFGKTKDIVNDLRSIKDLDAVKKQDALRAQLAGKLAERK